MISAPFCASRSGRFSFQRRHSDGLTALGQSADFLAQFAKCQNDGLASFGPQPFAVVAAVLMIDPIETT